MTKWSRTSRLSISTAIVTDGAPRSKRAMAMSAAELPSPTITTLREAGPPNHHDDKVHSDQQVVNSRGVAEPDDHHPARRTLLNLCTTNVQLFRGGLVFKAHRLLYHLRVLNKKRKKGTHRRMASAERRV